MAVSPVKFLFGFLILSIILWLIFVFASRLLAWFLSRVIGATVRFRVGGWKCLRDIDIKFKKGAVESVSVAEIRLSLRQSLVKLGAGFFSKEPKLQVLISDLEVVVRSSKKNSKRSTSRRSSTSGRGKWMVISMARFLSVSVTELNVKKNLLLSGIKDVVKRVNLFASTSGSDMNHHLIEGRTILRFPPDHLVAATFYKCCRDDDCSNSSSHSPFLLSMVQMPEANIEIKELRVDISQDSEPKQALFVKLHLLPIVVQLGETGILSDQLSSSNDDGCTSSSQAFCSLTGRTTSSFCCEEFSLLSEFGHDREVGVLVKNLDVTSGEVSLNLDEELFSRKKSSPNPSSLPTEAGEGATLDSSGTPQKQQENRKADLSMSKYTSIIPEKLSFSLPKLDVKFVHKGLDLVVENNIMGIQVTGIKSQCVEDVDRSTRLDIQMEFSEIHVVREANVSVLEVLKLAVVSTSYIPLQPILPVRSEVDVKLGGTCCNIIMSRIYPWLQLQSSKKKSMVLRTGNSHSEKAQSGKSKMILWACTVSAPEMAIVLYSMKDSPLYHGCLQSSHLFANNISSTGNSVHVELSEVNLLMAEEYQECLKESLFGVETNTGSLMHIDKVILDWGKEEIDSPDEAALKSKLVLSVDVTSIGIFLTLKRVESIISAAMSFKSPLKNGSTLKKRPEKARGHSSNASGKGMQLLKFNLERCSVNFSGDVGLDNIVVPDPKRVNYGSQGGRVIVSILADGTPRTANIMSTHSEDRKKLKYCICLDIFHFNLCMNKERQSTQVELKRVQSVYQEDMENKPTKVPFLDIQNAKFVRRTGGIKEIDICSLFSSSDITLRWEPDLHIAAYELFLQVKLWIHNQKLQVLDEQFAGETSNGIGNEMKIESPLGSSNVGKQVKKKESLFAIDVEVLNVSAEIGDGVEASLQVQSIFSENALIGVLLEGLILRLNEVMIFKSSRMQVSRIPSAVRPQTAISWDWIIQGLDFHICMPYRLHLRAIDDAVEDMFRALKLISAAKAKLILPVKKENSKAKNHANRIGCVKFSIRKINFEIEEEPFQGWLDEHYQLMKNVACESVVRLKFLDDNVSRGSNFPENGEIKDLNHDGKILHNGEEINLQDASAIQKMKDEIYRQSFRTYYSACQNLAPSEGSGACRKGFQADFKPSTSRTSLFSVTATELDLSLTRIEGGDAGMIEVIQKVDPVSREYNIPFSRLYGSNIFLQTGSLVVQIRDYTHPLLSGTSGKCEGRIVLAQQATRFQPQITQDVYVGRWRKVCMFRSASGTTPPIKTYSDLPIHFQKAEISFGVGFEPSFADISYAFTVALRRANLSVRNPNASDVQPPKKERSLPWWDDMRNYVHGKIRLFMSESRWNVLATTDPYEKSEKLQIVSDHMEIHQSDGRVYCSAKDFEILLSSLEVLLKNRGLKLPTNKPVSFIKSPSFTLEVTMDWECDSGNPMNHYLFALPNERVPREKVFDPFRSTSLSLRWDFSLRPTSSSCENQSKLSAVDKDAVCDGAKGDDMSPDSPVMVLGAHDLTWFFKFWSMNYVPPHKLRSFSRWPRFGVPRVARSGNLSLDKVMTEFTFRIDATPTLIKNMPLDDDDPAKGLTFKMEKLKYELFYSRGKQRYTFETKRDPLDLVYRGLDLHMPKAYISKENSTSVAKLIQMRKRSSKSMDRSCEKAGSSSNDSVKHHDDGFLLSSDYFTIRRQAPKADPATLLEWQQSGRRNPEITYVRSEFENGSESDEHTRSDPSDDDGYNVVIADNCQRIFVYGLKLLWTIENRDAVWSWVGGMSKAFESPKASPSRQYAQRKLLENNQAASKPEASADDKPNNPVNNQVSISVSQPRDVAGSLSSPQRALITENAPFGKISAKDGSSNDSEEEGTRHFMVNIVEPQFNLHSEDANGRFLLAAVSGRVLARSFHSVLQVGYDVIEKALGTGSMHVPEIQPEMTWNRMEFSVMLEHVQAHVAPTDVDPGAGLQWLPTIRRSSPKVKRTGPLLERVFMPCDMYFRYTRHKAGTADLKMKPLKELTFNSHNITATMTSRQFQVMLDVLTNLLFARLPKPRKSNLLCPSGEDEDVEEEADEVVPDGVEEVELAKIELEKKEQEHKLLLDDIRKLSLYGDNIGNVCLVDEANLWMINCGRLELVHRLKKELLHAKQLRKAASASLRMTLQKAAQLRLMEKEKNKSPSCAMRISMQMNKIVWSMLADGKSFAEAEINDMIYDFDRDYQDFGVARFTTKYFVVRNCLPNAKFDMILSPWNPPPEWGKKLMLRVDAKQGAPKDGNSPIETFQVEIYPLKIHLTETLYHMIWEYLFPEEEQDSQRRQDIWKVSTTAGLKRVKKGSVSQEASISSSQATKELEISGKSNSSGSQPSLHADSNQGIKLQSLKVNTISCSTPEHRRTSSLDRSWEESLAESVADELVLEAHSSSGKGGINGNEHLEEPSKSKFKEAKVKAGRYSHEDKKVAKPQEEKRSRPRKMRDFHNIKISQVELLVTYEGPPLSVTELRLLMDTFHRLDFTGTWRRLFSRVKKHVIWGVLKSVTGMQGKKFKDKAHSQRGEVGGAGVPNSDLNLSDSDGVSAGKSNGGQYPISWSKRPGDGAGDGFVTSIRGLFNSQRRKAKAFVLRTMRGEADNEFSGDWSESDSEFSPFARQLTITKAKKLIRRHTRKFRSRQKGSSSQQRESVASSPRETTFDSDYSSGSSPYEDFNE